MVNCPIGELFGSLALLEQHKIRLCYINFKKKEDDVRKIHWSHLNQPLGKGKSFYFQHSHRHCWTVSIVLCEFNFFSFPRTAVITWTVIASAAKHVYFALSYRYPLYRDKLLCFHWYSWSSPAYLWLSAFPCFGGMQSSLAHQNSTVLSLLCWSPAQQVEHSSHDLLLGLWKSSICSCNCCSFTPLFTLWFFLLPQTLKVLRPRSPLFHVKSLFIMGFSGCGNPFISLAVI